MVLDIHAPGDIGVSMVKASENVQAAVLGSIAAAHSEIAHAIYALALPTHTHWCRVRLRAGGDRGRCGIIDDVSDRGYVVTLAGGGRAAGLRRRDIEPTCLLIGHRVLVRGLKERKELNGQRAVVLEAIVEDYLAEAERYVVRAADGRELTLHRDNLEEEM
eukprot:gene47656-28809_t